MKICFNCKENKELNAFGKDRTRGDGLCPECKICRKIYRDSNKEKAANYYSVYWPVYKTKNKEKILNKHRIYNKKYKEEINKKSAVRRIANKKSINAQQAAYKKSNPAKNNYLGAKYRAQKLRATLNSLTKAQLIEIQDFYIKAVKLTKETGIPWEVDHIEPLQGKDICGLHVPWNLQLLTEEENVRKGNRTNRQS